MEYVMATDQDTFGFGTYLTRILRLRRAVTDAGSGTAD